MSKIILTAVETGSAETAETKTFRSAAKAQAYLLSLVGEGAVVEGQTVTGEGFAVTVEGVEAVALMPVAQETQAQEPEQVSAPQGWEAAGGETDQEPAVQQQEQMPETVQSPADLVTLVLPAETKETPLYLITPTMGSRPRWFEKARMHGVQKVGSQWQVTLRKREVKDRGLLAMAVTAGA